MEKTYPHVGATYGGEIETLVVHCRTATLCPLDALLQQRAQHLIADAKDSSDHPVVIDYDEAEHIIEFRGAVSDRLPQLMHVYYHAIATVQQMLKHEEESMLLSSSFHPFEDPAQAYQRVVPKPLYDLFRGTREGISRVPSSVLKKIYPTTPEKGRGWWHEIGAIAASVQPWNSLVLQEAASQIALLQATGWMFNLLTANAPFFQGRLTGKRDYRQEIWGNHGMLASSRYQTDHALAKNLPSQPMGLTDYYDYILRHQRPMVIPQWRATSTSNEYKLTFLAVIQPDDDQEFNALTYLQADHVRAIDIETGEEQEVRPSVAHVCNGFDFLYFPGYGARLRLSLQRADELDPRVFLQTIEQKKESQFHSLLLQAKGDTGFLCAEGRVSATVLPTKAHPGWERLSIPFVLQTALLRSHQQVFAFLKTTSLTWSDLTHVLPTLCNDRQHGFQTTLKGINATELARHIWTIAQQWLTEEEHALVGNTIDEILSQRMASAEEQIALFESLSRRYSRPSALRRLVEQFCMELPAIPYQTQGGERWRA